MGLSVTQAEAQYMQQMEQLQIVSMQVNEKQEEVSVTVNTNNQASGTAQSVGRG